MFDSLYVIYEYNNLEYYYNSQLDLISEITHTDTHTNNPKPNPNTHTQSLSLTH